MYFSISFLYLALILVILYLIDACYTDDIIFVYLSYVKEELEQKNLSFSLLKRGKSNLRLNKSWITECYFYSIPVSEMELR